jgi:hypothetical protein
MPVWLMMKRMTKMKKSGDLIAQVLKISALYHLCCRPGLWIAWVSMIDEVCPR